MLTEFENGMVGRRPVMQSALTDKEREQWVNTGKGIGINLESDKRFKDIERRNGEVERFLQYVTEPTDRGKLMGEKARLERERAELMRTKKGEIRGKIESRAKAREERRKKRELRKMVKQFHEVADEIDHIEEAFADRDPNSETMWQVRFPEDVKGQQEKKRYEKYKARLEELDGLIDWDKVDDTIDPPPKFHQAEEEDTKKNPKK